MELSAGTSEHARVIRGTKSPQNGAITRRRVTHAWTYLVALLFPQCSLGGFGRAARHRTRRPLATWVSVRRLQVVLVAPVRRLPSPAPLPADRRCGSGGQPRRARRFQSRIVSARATAGAGSAASAAIAARQIRVDLMISRSSYAYLPASAGRRGVRGRGARGSPPRSAAGGGGIHAPRATGSWSRRVPSAQPPAWLLGASSFDGRGAGRVCGGWCRARVNRSRECLCGVPRISRVSRSRSASRTRRLVALAGEEAERVELVVVHGPPL
jgi:hypothetical protein